ncbi:MAG: hypothetical protein JW812_00625 [Alphaproteobacteria bacterium]|nr:hypothetical protein [Alphaproteobacteria bacterium]MBN2779523.1 hypothetical protein [Alphaproteobacteria bacterium]
MFSEAFWKDEIARMGLPEMPLQKVSRVSESPTRCVASSYVKLLKSFLKEVGFSHKGMESLWRISLTREGIVKVREQGLPENLDVIFKVPLAYGGKAEIDNMLLIQTHPFSNMIFDFIRKQCKMHHEQSVKEAPLYGYILPPFLFVPAIEESVFVPASLGWASPAGNGSTDRMTEAGASMTSEGRG